ncbi:DUF1932 domain-containing protein [Alcaligenes sp. SDU_A2]|uniref:DUF1932 domain-containing protein n=1 Tax=Alcaligenes sp. SDU_A2 TaxID=3136634 RepID=UPI00311DA661
MSSQLDRIALIGAGEVARAYGPALKAAGLEIPFLLVRRATPQAQALAQQVGAQLCMMPTDGWRTVGGVLCAVTGAQASTVAQAILPWLSGGTLYMDVCTGEPQTMEDIGHMAAQHDIDFADIAIMGSVPTTGVHTALIAAGQGAGRAAALLSVVGAAVRVLPGKAGDAMRLKLLRSQMTKGLEALAIENLMLAERLGLRAELYEVLQDLDHHGLRHFMELSVRTHLVHGVRRRDEVVQVKQQMEQAGLRPRVMNGVLDFFEHTAATPRLQHSHALGVPESLQVLLEDADATDASGH